MGWNQETTGDGEVSDHDFKVGDRVLIKPEEIEGFKQEVARKIKDRIGEVTCLSYPSGKPVLVFPAVGRKKLFRMGVVKADWIIHAPQGDKQ